MRAAKEWREVRDKKLLVKAILQVKPELDADIVSEKMTGGSTPRASRFSAAQGTNSGNVVRKLCGARRRGKAAYAIAESRHSI